MRNTIRMTDKQFNSNYGYKALPPGPRVVLFLSEPIEAMQKDSPYDGYNEKRILDHLIFAVECVTDNREPWSIVVGLNPCQSKDEFNYLTWWSGRSKISVCEKVTDSLINMADLVVGMAGKDLLKAVGMHRPVISLQPRLKRPDVFWPNEFGASYSVYRIIDMPDAVEEVMYSTRVRGNMHGRCLELELPADIIVDNPGTQPHI